MYMDLLAKCHHGKYFWYDGCRCFARWTWHSISYLNHILCGGASNYLRHLVYQREDFVYTQHLHSPSRGFLLGHNMTTFALGTAAGDMTAITMHLGYFFSGVLFAVLIAIPALAYWLFGLNEIFAYWFAYIITRPLGASFADWMGVSHTRGGLGLGTGSVSLGLTIIILGLVSYLAVTRKDVKEDE